MLKKKYIYMYMYTRGAAMGSSAARALGPETENKITYMYININ